MAVTHPANELLTTASFAQIVGVVPDTVRLWERTGKVTPAFQTPTGINLYTRADAERFAAARKARQVSSPGEAA